MFFPSVQAVADKMLTPIGWGALITGIVSVSGWLVKRFIADITERANQVQEDIKEMRSNHLSHIEAYGAQTVALLQAQNVSLAASAESNKNTAVALAKIETLLSVNKLDFMKDS